MEDWLMIIIVVLLFLYILLIVLKSFNNRKKYLQMQSQVKIGEQVLFSNGLVGQIKNLNKEKATIECGNADLEVDRASIQMILKRR